MRVALDGDGLELSFELTLAGGVGLGGGEEAELDGEGIIELVDEKEFVLDHALDGTLAG